MKYYLSMWKKAFNFTGRSTRKEFWMAMLIDKIIEWIMCMPIIILAIREDGQQAKENMLICCSLLLVYGLATTIPKIALKIRRFHDINLSGWWVLICLGSTIVCYIGLVAEVILFCFGSKEDNQWGPNPYA